MLNSIEKKQPSLAPDLLKGPVGGVTEERMKIAREVRSKMNDNRTEFNWDHLQNFY